MPNLETLLERLVENHVEFVVVGGFAAVAHGSTLMTLDLDLCCPFTAANLSRLADALRGLNPKHRMSPERPPLRLESLATSGFKNIYLETDLGQLDLLGELSAIGPYEKVKERSETLDLAFGACRVLSLSALIETKRALGRPRDLAAVRELQAIQERLKES